MKEITVKQFYKLSDKRKLPYITLLDSVKAKEILVFNIDSLSWDDVKGVNKKLQKAFSFEDVYEVFNIVFKISKEDYSNLSIIKYFQIKKFLQEKFIYLHKNEASLLSSNNNDAGLWEIAGGRRLDYFADNLPLSQLAKIYGGYPFDYGKKPYNEIVYLLKMNKEQNEVENAFQELKYKQK